MGHYKIIYLGLFYVLCFVFLLECSAYFFHIPEYIFPRPSRVFIYVWEHGALFFDHTCITFAEAVLGVLLAFVVGILLGGVFLYFKWLEFTFFPLIFILQIIPLVALSPLMILWFGFGVLSKIWIVFIFALYPILSSFKNGLDNVEPEMLSVAQLLRASKKNIFFRILFPFCLLNAIFGLKIALTYSLTSAIVAEFLGSSTGLGVLLTKSLSSFNSLALFGSVYIIILVSSIMYIGAFYFKKLAQKKLGYQGE